MPQTAVRRFLGVPAAAFAALLTLSACQAPVSEAAFTAGDQEDIDRLMTLIDERLAVAPMVAQSKWNSGVSINAPEREAQILQRVSAAAAEAGVSEDFASAFFQAQFEASKIYQQSLHERWNGEGRPPFDRAPDLARDVRPLLDRLTPALIDALAAVDEITPSAEAGGYAAASAQQHLRDDIAGRPRAEAVRPVIARLSPAAE